jgi:hypothetical protein
MNLCPESHRVTPAIPYVPCRHDSSVSDAKRPLLNIYVQSHAGPPGGSYALVSGGLTRSIGMDGILGSPFVRSNLDPRIRELPVDDAQSLKLVLEIAPRMGYEVEVIDVAGSLEEVSSVPRDILDADMYPVLIRPDGARLVGAEWFTPRRLKRFLADMISAAHTNKLR